MPDAPAFADLLRRYRQRHGWSQADAVRETGVPLGTWKRWEGGGDVRHVGLITRLLSEVVGD